MQTESVGSSRFFERYPELFFLLSYTPLPPPETESFPLNQKLNLDGVDILYVYGIAIRSYEILESWLKEKRERRLIFLEDELQAIHGIIAEPFFLNPQVVIHYLSQDKTIDTHIEEIVAIFPSERIEVVAIDSYRKKRRFQKMRLTLLRGCAVAHAQLTESLYSHKMLSNLLCNIKRWHGSFFATGLKGKFKNIPAIICGAGPSLEKSIIDLKALEDRALIIAGGSTIAALSNQGIHPHIGVALDPNPEEFERLKIASSFEMPLIYATRLQHDVFNTINGHRGYLISGTGGPCEQHFEKQMEIKGDPIGPELGIEAMSVTTLSIALAVEMGCNPILFNGIDLAYTGMRRYSEGVIPSSNVIFSEMCKIKKAPERTLKRKDIHGHYVHTLVKWVMESECIASYAKQHPNHRFINVSSEGIGFPNIPNAPLIEVIQNELTLPQDLRAQVHAQIQMLQMPPLKEKIEEEMGAIFASLQRLKKIAEQMIEELERVQTHPHLAELTLPTGKMTILEIDFVEEKAFECLFPTLGPALDKLLSRAFFVQPDSTEQQNRCCHIEVKLAKWRRWIEMIDSEIAVFRKECKT